MADQRDRERRAVQVVDRLRAQLQAAITATVEAGEDIPPEVNEAVLVLDRWAHQLTDRPARSATANLEGRVKVTPFEAQIIGGCTKNPPDWARMPASSSTPASHCVPVE